MGRAGQDVGERRCAVGVGRVGDEAGEVGHRGPAGGVRGDGLEAQERVARGLLGRARAGVVARLQPVGRALDVGLPGPAEPGQLAGERLRPGVERAGRVALAAEQRDPARRRIVARRVVPGQQRALRAQLAREVGRGARRARPEALAERVAGERDDPHVLDRRELRGGRTWRCRRSRSRSACEEDGGAGVARRGGGRSRRSRVARRRRAWRRRRTRAPPAPVGRRRRRRRGEDRRDRARVLHDDHRPARPAGGARPARARIPEHRAERQHPQQQPRGDPRRRQLHAARHRAAARRAEPEVRGDRDPAMAARRAHEAPQCASPTFGGCCGIVTSRRCRRDVIRTLRSTSTTDQEPFTGRSQTSPSAVEG